MKSVLCGYVMYVTMFEEHTFHVFKNEVLRNISGSRGCKEKWRHFSLLVLQWYFWEVGQIGMRVCTC